MKIPRTLIFFTGVFLGLQVLWVMQPSTKCADSLTEFTGENRITCQEGANLEVITIDERIYFSCHCQSESSHVGKQFVKLSFK